MICSRCRRPITRAAGEVRLRDSVLQFGPTCAKLAGVVATPKPRERKPDPAQMPLC